MYPPINEQKAYLLHGNYQVSVNVGNNGLWLPSMVQITNNQIDYICEIISEFYNLNK